jgi:GTPase SAR1 family protein
MSKNILEAIEIMQKWLDKISDNNNQEIKETENLRMILLNLQITGAYYPEVKPIADRLQETITVMHDSTYELVHGGRKELREAFQEIINYILEKEKEQNDK